jgi:hypothetical protein
MGSITMIIAFLHISLPFLFRYYNGLSLFGNTTLEVAMISIIAFNNLFYFFINVLFV